MVSQDKGFTAQLDNSQLLQRWRALAPREQFSLGSLGAFLLLVLLYLTLWQPAQERLAAARSAFETQRELNAYLHSQAPAARNVASTPQQAIDPARLQGMVRPRLRLRALPSSVWTMLATAPCSSICSRRLLPSCCVGSLCCRSRVCKSPKPGWIVPKTIRWPLG